MFLCMSVVDNKDDPKLFNNSHVLLLEYFGCGRKGYLRSIWIKNASVDDQP